MVVPKLTEPTKRLLRQTFNCSAYDLNKDIRIANAMLRKHYNLYPHDHWDPPPQLNNMFAASVLVMHTLFEQATFLICIVLTCVHFCWDDEPVGIKSMVRDIGYRANTNAVAHQVLTWAIDPRIIRAF